MTFLLAHLSDPHIGPLPDPALHELIGKRLTGYWNWHKSRHNIHNMAVLETILTDLVAQSPDHVALTGDLVNIGLAAEFPLAQNYVRKLGNATDVSIIPGNHDAYCRDSLGFMQQIFAPHMTGDNGSNAFPYLRARGNIALLGLSSAVPTLPFMATGSMGREQRKTFDTLLGECKRRYAGTVVMIHHPPHRAGARWARRLDDAQALEEILKQHEPDLVLHGHNHRFSLAHLNGVSGKQVPIVGVSSASAVPGTPAHRAAYHLFRLTQKDKGLAIMLERRGIVSDGAPVTTLDHLSITD